MANVDVAVDQDGRDENIIAPAFETGYAMIETVETTKKKNKKIILQQMTVDFPEGCVTAIMGPSGCGKTTLLDFLTGSLGSGVFAHGEVNLPGTNAYVPQDDRLHGFFTCHSYLKHYSRLAGIKIDKENETQILSSLEKLGLSEHKDTIVGDIFLRGLSGGQKRRLSVGLEALTNPKNFFLDEPTSGLDAESAYQVMKFLKEYARAAPGRRVILTIHQPSSFIWQLVDHCVLLTKGRLVYQGPRKRMEQFFSSSGAPTPPEYNPADHYVTAVNDEFTLSEKNPDEWTAAFKAWHSQQGGKRRSSLLSDYKYGRASVTRISTIALVGTEAIESNRSGGFCTAVELIRRYFMNLFFNPGILGTRVAMYVMLALIIGALFWDLGDLTTYASIQSRIALMFYCVAFFVFMSIAVLPFTVIERAIVEKEVRNGYYHPVLYQVAQAIASVPGTALLAFLTTLLIITMTKLNEPLWYFLNMFLALVCAEALAQLMSHVVPHFIIGMALVAGFYGLFMLLQGFMLVPSEFPGWLRWSYHVAFHTYSWRTFMYNEFHGQDFPESKDEGFFEDGDQVLAVYEIEDINRTHDMIVLVGYAGVIHVCSFLVLWGKHAWKKHINAAATESQGEDSENKVHDA